VEREKRKIEQKNSVLWNVGLTLFGRKMILITASSFIYTFIIFLNRIVKSFPMDEINFPGTCVRSGEKPIVSRFSKPISLHAGVFS
jgi:hypothetical protein